MIRKLVVTAVAAALVAVGCDSGGDRSRDRADRARPTATASPSPDPCEDQEPFHIDDEPAQNAVLTRPDLPPGEWVEQRSSSCRWSSSSQQLLDMPECAALVPDPAAITDEHTGNGRATWLDLAHDIRLDHRSELYPSSAKTEAFQAVFTSPLLPPCLTAVLQQRVSGAPAGALGPVAVTAYDPGIPATELGVDYVGGIDVSTTLTATGGAAPRTFPLAIRIVVYRAGGGLGIVTLSNEGEPGATPDLDAVDLDATVRAAVENFLATF